MLKWALVSLIGALVLVAAALAALPWFLNTPAFQTYVANAASQALGRSVRFASLSISPFPLPTVKLRRLQVSDDSAFSSGPFLAVGEGRIGIRLRPLLSGRVELATLTLDAPRIALIEDARGRWNWASLGIPTPAAGGPARRGGRFGSPAPGALTLSRIDIVGGAMGYRKIDAGDSEIVIERVNLTLSQAAPGGPLLMRGDAVVQPGNVQLQLRDASLTPTPTGARSFADMSLKAVVDVAATDVTSLGARLAVSPVMTGALNGRFDVSGTPLRPVATGSLDVRRLALSDERAECEPRRRELVFTDVRVPIAYAGASLDAEPIEARLANGTISFRLGVATGPGGTATIKNLDARRVDLGPVLIDYFCQPYAVTGAMDLTGEARFSPGDAWRTMSGSGRVRVGRGKVMGREVVTLIREVLALAGSAAAVLAKEPRARPAAPMDFDWITATYTIANGVIRTKDLLYHAADLDVTAAGTVTLYDGRVDMKVTLKQGPNQVDGVISGTAGALHVVPTSVRVPDAQGIKKLVDRLLR